MSQIPSKELVRRSFYFKTYYQYIPVAEFISALKDQEQEVIEKMNYDEELKLAKEKTESIRRMNEIVQEKFVQEKSRLIEDFFDSTIGAVRNNILDVIDKVNESLASANDSTLPKGVTNRLRHMIKEVNNLNFFDDATITKALGELQEELGMSSKSEATVESVKKRLEKLSEIAQTNVDTFLNNRMVALEI